MSVFAQPAVSRNFEEIRALSWIWDKDSSEEVSGVWGDVFGECQRRGYDIFVEEVDIVTFGVRWVVIKG
jgi:hypothetical protein